MSFNKSIKEIETKIGYTFKDKSLLLQAFTRTSFCNENRAPGGGAYQSNEVLEFFGDSILSSAIVTLFIKEYTDRYAHGIRTKLAEGDFTVIRSKLSDKKNLSDTVTRLGLEKYLRMGGGDAKLGIADEPSVKEDLFESIVGAVYIDSGLDMTRAITVVAGMLDIKAFVNADGTKKSVTVQSFKNQLQEFCADKKRRLPPPVYKTLSESGPEHKKVYERACYIGDRLVATGNGKNQKLADSDAAEKALAILIAEDVKKKTPIPDAQAIVKLKELARQKKSASPVFRDLGETEKSTPVLREYAVMCSLGEISAIGVAQDKSGARCAAAEKVLARLTPEKPKPKVAPAPLKKKPAPKKGGSIRTKSPIKKGVK
jgi:ribonuclease-3